MKFTFKLRIFLLMILLSYSGFIFADSQRVLITEFMAINSNGIVDEDKEHSDWIELYNNTDDYIDLNGWYLTDKQDNLKEWKFPQVTIPKGGYIIVFASGKDRVDPTKPLHTNFKLSGSGEFLALCEPDTTISSSYNPEFPTQRQDVSFGFYQGQTVFFTTATPGAENIFGSLPFATNFSVKRGFYKNAFDVTLSQPGGDGQIYYTTNGTRPTKTAGTLYTTPVHITTTTPLSAVTINSSGVSSEVITNTYIFLGDVLNQSATPSGYPTDWKQAASKTSIPTDYQMDPIICKGSEYKDQMETALTSIPTMSIVTNVDYLFSAENNATTGGIYIYTGKPSGNGVNWVRPTSIEYFDPATNKEFQLNCQLKLHGGNSRNPANCPKHGFEFVFKSSFGPSKLNFDLFDEKKSAKEFNSLILRGSYNYSWVLLNNANSNQRVMAQYLQDSWTKTTQLEMGKPSGHEKFVHLYLNGLYWGIYNLAEDYTNDFMASYLNGKEDDFDVIKEQQYNPATYTTASPTAGNFLAWKNLVDQVQSNGISQNEKYQKLQGKNPDGTVNSAYANLLDVENYIDYMLLNYYIGNLDWNKNNWTAARNRITNDAGFRFFCWDAETVMTAIGTNIVTAEKTSTNPTYFMQFLVQNADFKVLLADRIQKHFLDEGGALTPGVTTARYSKLADEIDMPIIAESARWGDCSKTLYTKNDYWLPRKADLMENYFPYRTDVVLGQLRDAGLFPTIEAPIFTYKGGEFTSAIDLGMTSNLGTIYYTTDGSDPRTSITGVIAASAQTYQNAVTIGSSVTVKARAKSGSDWSPITEAVFKMNGINAIETLEAQNLDFINCPNPFTFETQISFNLAHQGNIELDIYRMDGRLVQHLYKGQASAGSQQLAWTSATNEKGVFICRLIYEGKSSYLKLLKI